MVRAVVGANWGDEGKGKITDMLGEKADIIVRFQGGANAGHTIINNYGKFALHTLPSGVFYGHTTSIIGNGVALDVPVLCMGLRDVVVSASPEGILVSDKEQSSYIKPFVDKIDQQIMFAEKSWGSFRVLDIEDESMTIKVTLMPGHKMNYHSHEHRDEVWTIIQGNGQAILDDEIKDVRPGDVLTMKAGCKHTIAAVTELKLIEVQLGKEISVKDKIKY